MKFYRSIKDNFIADEEWVITQILTESELNPRDEKMREDTRSDLRFYSVYGDWTPCQVCNTIQEKFA